MKQNLIDILKSRGFPVYLQGSLNVDAKYPDSFFTFWNFETPEGAFYDNQANLSFWGFWIYFYSSDPILVETEIDAIIKLLKSNGYVVTGKGEDADSGRDTHTGRMITVYKQEVYNE